jgi:hypothetical protein
MPRCWSRVSPGFFPLLTYRKAGSSAIEADNNGNGVVGRQEVAKKPENPPIPVVQPELQSPIRVAHESRLRDPDLRRRWVIYTEL